MKLKEYLEEEVLNEMGTNRKDALDKIHSLSTTFNKRDHDSKIAYILKYYYFEPRTTENNWVNSIYSALSEIFDEKIKTKKGKFSNEVMIDAILSYWVDNGNIHNIKPNINRLEHYFENGFFSNKYDGMICRGYSCEQVGIMFIKFIINIVEDFYKTGKKLSMQDIKEYLDKQLI